MIKQLNTKNQLNLNLNLNPNHNSTLKPTNPKNLRTFRFGPSRSVDRGED